MAVAVVDLLEVIGINHDQHRLTQPAGIPEEKVRIAVEGPAVIQAGELIHVPFVFDPLLFGDILGDVQHDAQGAVPAGEGFHPHEPPLRAGNLINSAFRINGAPPDFGQRRLKAGMVGEDAFRLPFGETQDIRDPAGRQHPLHPLVVLIDPDRNADDFKNFRELIGHIQQAAHHRVDVAAQLGEFRGGANLHNRVEVPAGDGHQLVVDSGNSADDVAVEVMENHKEQDDRPQQKVEGQQQGILVHALIETVDGVGPHEDHRTGKGKGTAAVPSGDGGAQHLLSGGNLFRINPDFTGSFAELIGIGGAENLIALSVDRIDGRSAVGRQQRKNVRKLVFLLGLEDPAGRHADLDDALAILAPDRRVLHQLLLGGVGGNVLAKLQRPVGKHRQEKLHLLPGAEVQAEIFRL